jgi:hypothetical protein
MWKAKAGANFLSFICDLLKKVRWSVFECCTGTKVTGACQSSCLFLRFCLFARSK